MLKNLRLVAASALFLTLLGCGGGDSGPTPGSGGSFTGIWSGETVSSSTGQRIKLNGIALQSGEAIFFAHQDGHVFNGSWIGSGGILTLNANAQWKQYFLGSQELYSVGWAPNAAFPVLQQTVNATGGYSEKSNAQLEYKGSLGDAGTLNLSYWNIHDRGSSLDRLAGTYANGPGLSVTINADGTFSGTDRGSNGFGAVTRTYSGRFSIIDSTKNAYRIQLSMNGLLFNGLAFLCDSATGKSNDAIQMALNQSAYGPFVHYWIRQ